MACVIHSAFIDAEGTVIYMSMPDSNSVSLEHLKQSFPLAETFFDLLFAFAARFNTFELIQAEVGIFSALLLVSPGMLFILCIGFNRLYTLFCKGAYIFYHLEIDSHLDPENNKFSNF